MARYDTATGKVIDLEEPARGFVVPNRTVGVAARFQIKNGLLTRAQAVTDHPYKSDVLTVPSVGLDLPPFGAQTNTGSGEVVSGVNTLTGRYSRSLLLSSITAPGGTYYPVSLDYLTPPPEMRDASLRAYPTGPIGYGWSMTFPHIVTQTKGTSYYSDDMIFLSLGPWGGGQLTSNGDGTFSISTNPNVRIQAYGKASKGVITRWDVVMPDSTILVFGGREDAIRLGLRNGWKVAQSGVAYDERNGEGDYPYRWDLTEIRSRHNAGLIRMRWNSVHGAIRGGTSYDREAWPTSIWSSPGGYTVVNGLASYYASHMNVDTSAIDSIHFIWMKKGLDEILPPEAFSVANPSPDPRLNYETRYLDSIEVFAQNVRAFSWKLSYVNHKSYGVMRRFLSKVAPTYGASVKDSGWLFGYDQDPIMGYGTGWLNKIVSPSMQVDSLVIGTMKFRDAGWYGGDSVSAAPSRAPTSKQMETRCPYWAPEHLGSTSYNNLTGLTEDVSQCRGEFCFYMLREAYVGDLGMVEMKCAVPRSPTAKIRLQIFQKVGSGVKRVYGPEYIQGDVIPGDGFFVTLDSTGSRVRVHEWDGSKFVESNPFQGDQRDQNFYATPVRVIMGSDYFLVEIRRTASREVAIVVRDAQGNWVSLNRDNVNCDIRSKPELIFESESSIRNETHDRVSECIEFETQRGVDFNGIVERNAMQHLLITAQDNFFVIATEKTGVEFVATRWKNKPLFEVEREIRYPTEEAAKLTAYQLISGYDYFASMYYNAAYGERGEMPIVRFVSNWNGNAFDRQDVTNNWTDLGAIEGNRWPTIQPLFDGFALLDANARLYRYRKEYAASSGNRALWTVMGVGEGGTYNTSPNARYRVGGTRNFTTLQFNTIGGLGAVADGVPWGHPNALSLLFLNGVDVTRSLTVRVPEAPLGLADIQISPDENWLIGKAVYSSTRGKAVACSPSQETCSIDVYQVVIPKSSSGAIEINGRLHNWIKIDSGSWNIYPSRVLLAGDQWMSVHSHGTGLSSVSFHPMYSNALYPRSSHFHAVAEVVNASLAQGEGAARVLRKTVFEYSADSGAGYQGSVLSPASKWTRISQLSEQNEIMGSLVHSYWMQGLGAHDRNAIPDSTYQVGRLISSSIAGSDGKVTVRNPEAHSIRHPEWGPAISMIKDTAIESSNFDPNGARQSFQSLTGRYDRFSMQPQVQLSLLSENLTTIGAPELEYRHSASIRLFNTSGMPIEVRSILYRDKYKAMALLDPNHSPSLLEHINEDVANRDAVALSGVRTAYEKNNIDAFENYAWGGVNVHVDASMFGSGQVAAPTSYWTGWTKVDSVGVRSSFGQPRQMVSVIDKAMPTSSMYFFEGVRSLVSAVISPAWPDNSAVLTSEDGQKGLNDNTWSTGGVQEKWVIPQGVTYDKSLSHLGRYSMKVVDSYGPTINLYLQDREDVKNGIEISLWAYTAGAPLQISAQLRRGVNADLDPVGWNTVLSKTI